MASLRGPVMQAEKQGRDAQVAFERMQDKHTKLMLNSSCICLAGNEVARTHISISGVRYCSWVTRCWSNLSAYWSNKPATRLAGIACIYAERGQKERCLPERANTEESWHREMAKAHKYINTQGSLRCINLHGRRIAAHRRNPETSLLIIWKQALVLPGGVQVVARSSISSAAIQLCCSHAIYFHLLTPSLSYDCDVLFDGASGCVHLLYAILNGRNPMDCGYSRVSTSCAAPLAGCATQSRVQTTQPLPFIAPLIGRWQTSLPI